MSEMFKMDNKTYDTLKWLATTGLPVLNMFISAIMEIWHMPYMAQIVGSIAALNTALGGWLQISSKLYKADSAV